jgi:hypothetical protein
MSSIVQCSLSELRKLGATVTIYYVGEIQQLAICSKDEPFVHIVEANGQRFTIPVPELERLSQSISHLEPHQEILLFYQAHSGFCIFQYSDTHGNVATFRITNQLQFKAPAVVS